MNAPVSPSLEITVPSRPQWINLTEAFGRHGDVELDAGSGKGRFLLARSAKHTGINYLGIERQKRRIRKVEAKALRQGISNIRLIQGDLQFILETMIPDHAIRVVYLFFPDPWPKRRHNRRRLINVDFLKLISRKIKLGGALHFATDHDDYYASACAQLEQCPTFSKIPPFIPSEDEKTDFELLFSELGKTTKRYSVERRNNTKHPEVNDEPQAAH